VAASGGDAGAERFSRAFDVLELLVGHGGGLTLTEIAKRLSLPASSTHNLLQRMAANNLVVVTDDLRYSLGSRAVRLGIRIVDGVDVRALARRPMQELARETGDDIYLAVRMGNRVFYVDKVAGTRPITVDIRLGQPLYLHATAVGKLFAANNKQLYRRLLAEERPQLTAHTLTTVEALDAEFERIRADEYSVSREEAILGIVGMAYPIRDAYGELAAAIHVSAPLLQIDEQHERVLLDAAREAARAIERDLGRMDTTETRTVRRAVADAS
jgi:DNA-binding IclR family transcriptional regulator